MYVSKFRISNYKSFFNSPEISLTPGFNIIVGQNDAGKTALLEALSLSFRNLPHRSRKTVQNSFSSPSPSSKCSITFCLDPNEAKTLLEGRGSIFVPKLAEENSRAALDRFLTEVIDGGDLKCVYQPEEFIDASLGTLGKGDRSQSIAIQSVPGTKTFEIVNEGNHSVSINQTYEGLLAIILRGRLYAFKAERLNIGAAPISFNPVLEPNARNLASVLNFLQTNDPYRFERYQQAVISIFPHITQITVPPTDPNLGNQGDHVGIQLWTIPRSEQNPELAIKLTESGTGIGQVLAILYVVFAAREPQVIIIDEPQSFLHPGAVKKLLEILKQQSQHQYVITSHSPIAITSTNPKTLFWVRRQESESVIEHIDTSKNTELRSFLRDIGASLSDVFGADAILWVEGATEEICFPLILTEVAKQPLLGVQIIGVLSTGNFESKHAKIVFKMYERLSEGRSLLPPAVGYVFDRERRSDNELRNLANKSEGRVEFLNRIMYENYLLNSNAICDVLQKADPSGQTVITPQDVEQWLESNGTAEKYFEKKVIPEKVDSGWIKEVHAARILEDLFQALSSNRVLYNKVQHGKDLTQWMIRNAPSELKELADLLKSMVAPKQS